MQGYKEAIRHRPDGFNGSDQIYMLDVEPESYKSEENDVVSDTGQDAR